MEIQGYFLVKNEANKFYTIAYQNLEALKKQGLQRKNQAFFLKMTRYVLMSYSRKPCFNAHKEMESHASRRSLSTLVGPEDRRDIIIVCRRSLSEKEVCTGDINGNSK